MTKDRIQRINQLKAALKNLEERYNLEVKALRMEMEHAARDCDHVLANGETAIKDRFCQLCRSRLTQVEPVEPEKVEKILEMRPEIRNYLNQGELCHYNDTGPLSGDFGFCIVRDGKIVKKFMTGMC